MKPSDGKIGGREFMSIIILSMLVKVSDTTPAILYQAGLSATWIMSIVSFMALAIPLLVLNRLLYKYDTGLVQLIYLVAGRYVGFVLGLAIFFIAFMGTNLNVRSYGDILNFLFFPKTPLLVICGLLFAASCYIASRGLESIGRTGWVIVPYVLVVYLVLVILVWKNIEWRNLTPLLGPGLDHLALSGVRYSSIFSEVIVLTIFFPHVRSKKEYQSGIWLGWGIVVVMMVIFLALFVFVFDFNSTRKEAFPFQHLTRFADFGPYIQHVEALFLGFWVMAGVVHFAIYIFATSAILGHTLKIDKWEPLILPITGLALLVGMLPENMTTTVFLSREMLLTGASCFFIILPFLLWTVDRFRGRIRL